MNYDDLDLPLPLNQASLRELWSKTYNSGGKPDWSHLFPYYHPEIIFKDSIQEIRGKEEFIAMCNRLSHRCRKLHMDIRTLVETENTFFMEWEMTMVFRNKPESIVYGCSRLTLHPDGRILQQRDYYDLWGDIFDNIPLFGKAYRRFMKRKFG